MPGRIGAVGLVLALGLSPRPALAVAPLAGQIGGCLDNLAFEASVTRDSQRINLRRYCPDLPVALAADPLVSRTGHGSVNFASVDELRDLRALVAGAQPPAPSAARFDFDGLAAHLAAVQQQPEPELSWWQRFTRWLEELLTRKDETRKDKTDMRWLEDLLKKLEPPDWLKPWLSGGTLALVVLAALWVVLNELNRGGVWRGWWAARRRARAVAVASADDRDIPLTWDGIAGLPPLARAPAALRLLIARLVAIGLLPEDRSRTARELAAGLRTAAPDHGARFEAVVEAADTALYGERLPADTWVDAAQALWVAPAHARPRR